VPKEDIQTDGKKFKFNNFYHVLCVNNVCQSTVFIVESHRLVLNLEMFVSMILLNNKRNQTRCTSISEWFISSVARTSF